MTTIINAFTVEPWMPRATHLKKEVEEALKYVEAHEWRISVGGSHAWGRMFCPYNDAQCRHGEYCIMSVWSTPGNPGKHGKRLKRVVDNCSRHRSRAVPTKIKAKQ